jgi:starch synthase
MNLLFVSSEVTPFSKSGGLADVVGALSRKMAAQGHRVLVVSPAYSEMPGKVLDHGIDVVLGGWHHHLAFRHHVDGADFVFLEHAWYRRGGLYGDANGSFGDNHLRYAALCRAALEAARFVTLADGKPLGEDIVVHAHDWQGSLVSVYLDALYRPLSVFPKAAVVQTLHNLAHQGLFPAASFRDLELPPRFAESWALEWHGNLGLLKAGILFADQLTTVSPNYAREIQTSEGGFHLDPILRHRNSELTGILNGVDVETWNPASDPHIAAAYSATDLDGKHACKAALQREVGLTVDARAPLVGVVSRLDPQKGVELMLDSLPWLVERGAQFVVLGSAAASHRKYEEQFRRLAARFPGRVAAAIGFSEALAHRIEAGADLFCMPSRFEPCGLNQLYSLRYGTPPVVRTTGGLADSVPAELGFRFHAFSGIALRGALHAAISEYVDSPDAFSERQVRCMTTDVSWNARVPTYEAVYKRAQRARA